MVVVWIRNGGNHWKSVQPLRYFGHLEITMVEDLLEQPVIRLLSCKYIFIHGYIQVRARARVCGYGCDV